MTWYPQVSGTSNQILSIKFYNNIGFASSYNGLLLKTFDGGITWTSEQSLLAMYYNAIEVTGDACFIGGSSSTILKKDISLTGNNNNNHEIPKGFSLSQNYPNPFNPSTNIKFSAAKSGLMKITVYDITGREVTVLVNEFFQAGMHEVKFNAANLSSGTYFYKMESEGYSDVKKMMLIK